MQFFLLALIATLVGGIAGIGGGMIIRPALEMGAASVALASFTSAATVLAMATVNVFAATRKGAKIRLQGTLFIAVGSVVGGFVGGSLLQYVTPRAVTGLFIVSLLLVLGVVILRKVRPSLRIEVKHWAPQLLIGLCTGVMSGFFGIGGGPFQMAALLIFMGLEDREAAFQSTCITLLTTLSSLGRYTMAGYADFSLIVYTVPGGLLGGLIGGLVAAKLPKGTATVVLCAVVAVILVGEVMRWVSWGA